MQPVNFHELPAQKLSPREMIQAAAVFTVIISQPQVFRQVQARQIAGVEVTQIQGNEYPIFRIDLSRIRGVVGQPIGKYQFQQTEAGSMVSRKVETGQWNPLTYADQPDIQNLGRYLNVRTRLSLPTLYIPTDNLPITPGASALLAEGARDVHFSYRPLNERLHSLSATRSVPELEFFAHELDRIETEELTAVMSTASIQQFERFRRIVQETLRHINKIHLPIRDRVRESFEQYITQAATEFLPAASSKNLSRRGEFYILAVNFMVEFFQAAEAAAWPEGNTKSI